MTKCTTNECPIKKACLRYTVDAVGCQWWRAYEFKIIGLNENHVMCDHFKSNNV